jgi:hypothetical protein
MCFLVLQAFGQKEVKVIETAKEMSRGLQPSFVVNIPETQLKTVERAWIKHLQKGTRSRVKKDKQEMTIPGAAVEGLQGGMITVYSRLIADKEDVMLIAFFEIDSVFFLSQQDPEKARGIHNYLREFALETYRNTVKDQLKMEERKLQTMQKLLGNLQDIEKKNDNIIKENKRAIGNLEDAIRENNADQDRKNQEIETQKDKVVAMKEFPEEAALAQKGLKQLKREKKKLQSQNESLHKKIDRLEEQIKKAERDIRIGKEQQKLQEKENIKQQDAVKAMEKKLAGIL